VKWIQGIPPSFWAWATALSLFTLVVSLLILRAVILRLPRDYFLPVNAPERALASWPEGWRALGLLLKNLGGALVILVGVLMCFGPGQGLLTILIGVSLVDFPGKRKIEVFLIKRPTIHRPLNWFRERKGEEPLLIP